MNKAEKKIVQQMMQAMPRKVVDLTALLTIVDNSSLICKIFRLFDKRSIAFTLGPSIYIVSSKNKISLECTSHEAIHSIQFAEFYGIVPMLSDYFAHHFVLFAKNRNWHDAYMNVPQEVEAYKYEVQTNEDEDDEDGATE